MRSAFKSKVCTASTAEPARLRVYDGEAVVPDASGQLTVKSGKQTNLDGVLLAESFDRKDTGLAV